MNTQEFNEQIAQKSAWVSAVKQEMAKVVVGQQKLVNRLILSLLCKGHVLLEGVPGLAKTLSVKALAGTMQAAFSRIQFTPDLLPADLLGTMIYNPEERQFTAKKGPVFANLILADEINRAPAKVQSALLECMQEKQITIAGESYKLPSPFLVLATQNPIEQEGTYPLPEAQLDRFMFKLKVDYPKRAEEEMVIRRMAHPAHTTQAVAVGQLEDIANARTLVDQIYLDEKIVSYILDLVFATRPGKGGELSERQGAAKLDQVAQYIQFGASPRASIALAVAARGAAFLAGRAYVVPQDVKDVAPDVLRHRIILSYEAEAENVDADMVIKSLLDELRTP